MIIIGKISSFVDNCIYKVLSKCLFFWTRFYPIWDILAQNQRYLPHMILPFPIWALLMLGFAYVQSILTEVYVYQILLSLFMGFLTVMLIVTSFLCAFLPLILITGR